jgi:hypothetical protein
MPLANLRKTTKKRFIGVYELYLPAWNVPSLFRAGALLRGLEDVENDLRELKVKGWRRKAKGKGSQDLNARGQEVSKQQM